MEAEGQQPMDHRRPDEESYECEASVRKVLGMSEEDQARPQEAESDVNVEGKRIVTLGGRRERQSGCRYERDQDAGRYGGWCAVSAAPADVHEEAADGRADEADAGNPTAGGVAEVGVPVSTALRCRLSRLAIGRNPMHERGDPRQPP